MLGSRQLSMLAVLAMVAVGIAFWLTSSRQPTESMAASGPLLPSLSARLNDVSEVAISAAGQRIATLRKSDDGWVMPERDNYAVDIATLRSLLVNIDHARRIEPKTRNPERYAKLGVEDPLADASATGVRVDIKAGDDNMGVIIGSNRQGGSGTYVRRVDDAQSWLADRNIAVERRPARWLQRQLIDIPASRIHAVTVEHPTEGDVAADQVRIEADGSSGFRLLNPPAGREPDDGYAAEALAGFLADLRFDELASVETHAVADAGAGSAEFQSSDGIVVTLRFWSEGEQPQRVWASFSVDLEETRMQEGVAAAQAAARVAHEAAEAAAKRDPTTDETADDVSAADAADPGRLQSRFAPR